MGSVNSQSSRQDVLNAMADNAGYAEDNSLPEAQAFMTACRVYLSVWAFRESSTLGGNKLQLTPELVQAQLEDAKAWVAGQPAPRPKTGGNVVGISVTDFRGDLYPGLGGPCEW